MVKFLCIAALAFGAIVTTSSEAQACSCIRPPAVALMSQDRGLATNSHIAIQYSGAPKEANFVLQTAGGRLVATTMEAVGTEFDSIVVIKPSAALRPETDYEVLWAHSERKPHLVKAFRTGSTTNLQTPRWKGVAKATYKAAPGPRSIRRKDGTRVIRFDSCSVTSPTLSVRLRGRLKDDETPRSDLLYAVWFGTADTPLDLSKPPQGLVREFQDARGRPTRRLQLGRTSNCDANLLEVPPREALRLGLAVIDGSGNMTRPLEVPLR